MPSKKESRSQGSSAKPRAKPRKVGIQDVPGGLGLKRRERSDDADSEGSGGTLPASESPLKRKRIRTNQYLAVKPNSSIAARALECGVSMKDLVKDQQASTT